MLGTQNSHNKPGTVNAAFRTQQLGLACLVICVQFVATRLTSPCWFHCRNRHCQRGQRSWRKKIWRHIKSTIPLFLLNSVAKLALGQFLLAGGALIVGMQTFGRPWPVRPVAVLRSCPNYRSVTKAEVSSMLDYNMATCKQLISENIGFVLCILE